MKPWSATALAAAAVIAMTAGVGQGAGAVSAASLGSRSGWGPAVTLSGRLNASAVESGAPPSAAVAANGAVRVVWVDKQRVMTVTMSPGHPWSKPRLLYRSGAAAPAAPQVAVDPWGNQVVVWTQGHTLRALRRPAGGSWQARPVMLAVLPGRQRVLSWVRLVVGADGTTVVAFWSGRIGHCLADQCRLRHASASVVIRPPKGPWRKPSRFAGPVDSTWGFVYPTDQSGNPSQPLIETPAAVVYNGGTVTVGWSVPSSRRPSWTTGPVLVRTKVPGARWSARQRLSRAHHRSYGFGSEVTLAATSWGDVVAAWSWRGLHDHQLVETRSKLVGGSWGHRQPVFANGWTRGLGVDEAGNATLLVVGSDLVRPGLYTLERPRGGSWGRPTRITPPGMWQAQLAVDSTGEAVAAGLQSQGPRERVLASFHRSGTPWPQSTQLGDDKAAPLLTVAIGADDTGVVVWYRFAGKLQRVVVMMASVHRG
jgi:hypothetical protein